jgi:hypothetical protein
VDRWIQAKSWPSITPKSRSSVAAGCEDVWAEIAAREVWRGRQRVKNAFMALRSAFEIAMERGERRERLDGVMAELLDHVALLDECWDRIRPRPMEEVSESVLARAA